MTDLKEDLRLILPVAFAAFQEMVEKAQLQLAAVIRIEMRPVLEAMRFEVFVLAFTSDKPLKIPARMQPLPAPVGGGEERHGDLVPYRRAALVVLVVERMGEDLVAEVGAVLRQRAVAQRFIA